MDSQGIVPFIHQNQICRAPWVYRDIEYFFLIGGYGCGKTASDVFFLLSLCQKYYSTPITIGVGGATITLLRKTLVQEFEKMLIMSGTTFTDDKNSSLITVGCVTIILIALEQPQLIFAYNFSVFLGDELDELPASKAMEAFKAIQERTRVVLPDGRAPFSVFSTTAQGFAGTYTIVETLRELKQKFVLVRGLTKNNTSLSPSYIKRLYSLYTDNERLAYLEGFFVNLNTGRVYGDYESAHCMTPFVKVNEGDVVHIGQDLNAGFSKGVAIIQRGEQLIIVASFSFGNIAHAPRLIRNAFPMNRILWYPDASAKEIMNGYTAEIKAEEIELRIGSVNPSVVERIFIVNKMFRCDHLKLSSHLKDLDTILKTRQYDDVGKPEKGKGTLAPDHFGDALEYVTWRLVSSIPLFRDLWMLTRTARQEEAKQMTRRSA